MSSKIPQPPGVPLLGNIFDVDPNDTWNSLIKLSKQYGPICKINVLGKQIVFIGNVALLEEICDEHRFRKCVTGPVVEMRACANDCLFTAYDNESIWGVAHRIMAPSVSAATIKSKTSFADMATVIPDLTRKWTSSHQKRVLFTNDLDRLLMTSVMQCFYNQRIKVLNETDDPGENSPPLIEAWESITMEAMKRPTRPKLLTKLLYAKKFTSDIQLMREFATNIVKARVDNSAQDRDDLLHALLHTADPVSGEKLSESRVVDEVVTMFIGAATSANLVSYALYYLLRNREVLAKAREEIDSVVGGGGGSGSTPISFEHLNDLHYIEAIIRETLRLSATAPGFNIEPIPTEDKSPILLAGTMISVLHTVNRDPDVFEEPESFLPERMLGEKWEALPKGARRGFGNGKRECYGKMWAWRWSIFTLASIIHEVEFEFSDPKYELTSNGAFSVKPLEFYGLVSPRERSPRL
ncbi:Cytochrome P450 [Penicillium cosmopolitanum]|uniref:Self-sufficient cytochrome P450 monooxygenase CYP505E4 n=1 Tax=Penicillium cosmopolitanum TaxID=1131564 RepID=A0A9X0BDG4_9EURO|nr:Cytochrome P450 [Penicillium cosmopolitanum]KAJ5408570.1 Cytochrome P450 [Penicillium cosmopolitanum]